MSIMWCSSCHKAIDTDFQEMFEIDGEDICSDCNENMEEDECII